ncbi:MAG: PHP domain-containing protein [Christensenellaceae bacterium]
MKFYQAETHCHTKEVSPCSRIPAKFLVDSEVDAGYKYLFITDHYHPYVLEKAELYGKTWDERMDYFMSGYKKAKEYAQGKDLTVLLAMEIVFHINHETTLGDDFLVYGMDEKFLRENPYLYKMEINDFYQLMKENGFLVFQAHPYRYGRVPVEPICYDGIEMVNTHPRHFSRNGRAVDFCAKHDLLVIGGSDIHSEEDVSRGGVMLPEGIQTPMDFVDYYKENGSPELIVTFGA